MWATQLALSPACCLLILKCTHLSSHCSIIDFFPPCCTSIPPHLAFLSIPTFLSPLSISHNFRTLFFSLSLFKNWLLQSLKYFSTTSLCLSVYSFVSLSTSSFSFSDCFSALFFLSSFYLCFSLSVSLYFSCPFFFHSQFLYPWLFDSLYLCLSLCLSLSALYSTSFCFCIYPHISILHLSLISSAHYYFSKAPLEV